MHVTQNTIFNTPEQFGFFGTTGMCPVVSNSHLRPLKITVSNNKQIESKLSELGMT
ncbi:MAG: hypothetical protein ACC657_02585 [Thiohalomonadales bacterium]